MRTDLSSLLAKLEKKGWYDGGQSSYSTKRIAQQNLLMVKVPALPAMVLSDPKMKARHVYVLRLFA